MPFLQLPKELLTDFANPATKPIFKQKLINGRLRPKYFWSFDNNYNVRELADGPGDGNATVQNGSPSSVILPQGRAVRSLDTNDDRMVSGTISHGIGTGNYTVLAHFIKRSSAGSFDGLVSNGNFNPAWMYTTTTGPWGMYDGGTKNANTTLIDGNEYVLCNRRSGTTAVDFFLNGLADGSTTSTINATDDFIRFFSASAAADRDTSVDLFWVAIYDKALSDSEIKYIYDNRGTWAYEPACPIIYKAPDGAPPVGLGMPIAMHHLNQMRS